MFDDESIIGPIGPEFLNAQAGFRGKIEEIYTLCAQVGERLRKSDEAYSAAIVTKGWYRQSGWHLPRWGELFLYGWLIGTAGEVHLAISKDNDPFFSFEGRADRQMLFTSEGRPHIFFRKNPEVQLEEIITFLEGVLG
jgi:hypothetical protein